MAQQQVELRKIRDFSDNLNDTFVFIRQNLKPLLASFLGIAGIFMLVTAIVSGLYQRDVGSFFEQIIRAGDIGRESPTSFINGQYFLVLFLTFLNIVAMQVAIISYMKLYETGNGQTPQIEDVWNVFKSYFLLILVYSIVISIVMAAGLLFCILPGIYFIVVLIPFPIIVMMEDRSFGDAFSRCFKLAKDQFWISLGIYLLVYLIYSFSSGIISTVVGAFASVIYYFSTKNISNTVGVFTSILSIFSFVFYIVYYVSVVLHYFNLSEIHDGTGMMRKLDNLGETSQNFDNIQEQY